MSVIYFFSPNHRLKLYQFISAVFTVSARFGLTRWRKILVLDLLVQKKILVWILLDQDFYSIVITRFKKIYSGLVTRFRDFSEITRSGYSGFHPSNGQFTRVRRNRVNFGRSSKKKPMTEKSKITIANNLKLWLHFHIGFW